MTTYYFVLMIMFQGSNGWVDTPNKYTDLKFCQAKGITNAQIIGHGVKWKCVKRTETHQ